MTLKCVNAYIPIEEEGIYVEWDDVFDLCQGYKQVIVIFLVLRFGHLHDILLTSIGHAIIFEELSDPQSLSSSLFPDETLHHQTNRVDVRVVDLALLLRLVLVQECLLYLAFKLDTLALCNRGIDYNCFLKSTSMPCTELYRNRI